MAVTFQDAVRTLLDGKNFATVSTLNPDGSPQSTVVWYERDGDTIVFSATTQRQKVRNLTRDPRISVSVYDLSNPYTSVEIRGTAELVPDTDKRLPAQLAGRYTGKASFPEPDDIERVIVRVLPEKVIPFGL